VTDESMGGEGNRRTVIIVAVVVVLLLLVCLCLVLGGLWFYGDTLIEQVGSLVRLPLA
jgi:hypothetical protein